MSKNLIETVMGAVVLAVAGFFIFFAYSKAEIGTVEGYEIRAKFDRIDGVRAGSDVRMSGIKIGTVTSSVLDPKTAARRGDNDHAGLCRSDGPRRSDDLQSDQQG